MDKKRNLPFQVEKFPPESRAQFITDKAGNEKTLIGKLSVKEKKELTFILKDSDVFSGVTNTRLLRAFLAAGLEPSSELLSAEIISQALTMKDSIRCSSKLVKKITEVKGGDLFAALMLIIGQEDKEMGTLSNPRSVMGFVRKWTIHIFASGGKVSPDTEESIL